MIHSSACQPQADPFPALSGRHGEPRSYTTPWDTIKRLEALRLRGDIPFNKVAVLYVLGRYKTDQASEPTDLLPFLDQGMPRFPHWTTCAFGKREAACVVAGALLGGHIRVGFENNLWLPDGRLADGNQDLVAMVRNCIVGLGQNPATADEVRAQWQ